MTRALRSALLALALALAGAGAAHAQDPRPAPRDTLPRPAPRDTTPPAGPDSVQVGIPPEAVRGDTLPNVGQDTVPPDSTIAAPSFPAFPLPPGNGFADGTWFFGARELGQFHGMSVAALLDRIPGLSITRGGSFGRPLGISPFFSGGGRLRVFLDGYELRAMSGATPDLQRIPIVNLAEVRVERGMHEVRVDLTSFRLTDIRPYALIEGMDGDYDSRALRGMFTRPIGRRFVGEIALDLVETDGFLRREPYGSTHIVGRLGYQFRPDLGVQLEYRSSAIDAQRSLGGNSFDSEILDRTELVLRGRGRFLGRLNLEAMIGRTRQEPASAVDTLTVRTENLQAEIRASIPARIGQLTGGVRLHRGEEESWAPDATEIWGRLDFIPAPWLAATGQVRALTFGDVSGLETQATLRAGPWGGIAVFGQLAAGKRGIPYLSSDSVIVRTVGGLVGLPGFPELDTVLVRSFQVAAPSLSALRAGAELTRGSMRFGAAVVSHDVGEWVAYGYPYDRTFKPLDDDRLTGVEAYATFPVYWRQVRFGGWYQRWLGDADRPYLPTQLGRAALEFTGIYRGGNLEPVIRLELEGRDQALAPNRTTGALDVTPRYFVMNSYVQVRILEVRAFWRFDNIFNQRGAFDVPGTEIPGGRAIFGVRWFFRN
ncbi:MAG TPA: Plug domain-containing protein [Longimicrobium sp.]|nr:Plug domain-containing protein [Longimicrobium sp.]